MRSTMQIVQPGSRRAFLKGVAFGVSLFATPGLYAEILQTPRQTLGPFYPDPLPLDTDNDLILLNDSTTPAVGEVTHLGGRVMDAQGAPVRNAVVEIWQVDSQGIYLHGGSPHRTEYDRNFQGFGRFLTGSDGEYYFRTIKPVPYAPDSPQRAPHIHFAVRTKGADVFSTQCYVKGHPMNDKDGVFRSIAGERERQSVLVDFQPLPDSAAGELAARFNIVLGLNAAPK